MGRVTSSLSVGVQVSSESLLTAISVGRWSSVEALFFL